MDTTHTSTRSFLRAIARDTAANVLAISAAAMVPLLAMVGGGVDTSRFFMTQTRLQQACDAGALAARQAMLTETLSTDARDKAEAFFDQNFPEGMFGMEGLTRNYSATDGEVNGTATGTLPSTIMGMFGFGDYILNVSCKADINISNTDIMFVIDTTGSMAWTPAGRSCGFSNGFWNECPGSRIQGVRDATMAFYDTVEESTSPRAQVRYGVVPYSSGVNVGTAIMAENPNWMARSHTYNSREGDVTFGEWEPISTNYERTGFGRNWQFQNRQNYNTRQNTFDDCVEYYNSLQSQDNFNSSDPAGWTQVSATNSNPRTITYTGVVNYTGFYGGGGTYRRRSRRCNFDILEYTYDADSTITVTEEREEIFEWVYRPVSYNLSPLYDDNKMEAPTGWNNALETVTWDGCIEEASTVANSVFDPVPAGAFDLDINLRPTNDSQRWKPALRDLTWMRVTNPSRWWTYTLNDVRIDDEDVELENSLYFCPRPARRLEEISRFDLETYVDELRPDGATYHDIGMIWGARFVAPDGIFSADNATAPNGDDITRHIVFLTDGELAPNDRVYTPYGTHWWDRRIHNGTNNNQVRANHAARFQAACRAARNENVSVWVVAFGTALTQNLIDCATSGRAYSAQDTEALEDAFREIAQKIAQLRLTG